MAYSFIHSFVWGSLDSFRCVMVVVGTFLFISIRMRYGVVGLIWGRWVDSVAPWGSLGSFGVVGYIQVRPGCCSVYSGSLV